MGMMAPPYQRPLPAQRGNPRAVAWAAAPAPVETSRVNSSLHAASSESEAGAENITVSINGMRFEPESITVKLGTKVTWVHDSNMPHTITGEVDGLRSSTLYGGQQYSHTFDATGRYNYACDFHPSMKGSVIVEATGRDT
jgi:plastocyanin